MDFLFDMRPDRPGFRLKQLELFNWGTFDSTDGHVFRFEPEGRTSLLVGHNGSGKSTLVDAILTLLVEPRTRNYNVAAGARKTERTEKSYLRGAYGRTSDDANAAVTKYLRPQGTNISALSAVFHDEQLGKAFTLCQVLYLTADGTTEKLFAVADEARELKGDLQGVRQADGIAGHFSQLGYETTKKFLQYRRWLTKRTGMLPKAMDMFNQTVAVKDIQSLNEFIRKHMLDRHDWQDAIRKLLSHFHDLSIAHQELVRARTAMGLLVPVEGLGLRYQVQAATLAEREQQLAASEIYFREQTVKLFEPELAKHRAELAAVESTVERVLREQKSSNETIRHLQNEIDLAGGERLKAIPQLIEMQRNQLHQKQTELDRYQTLLKRAGMNRVVHDADTLLLVRDELRLLANRSEDQLQRLTEEHVDLVVQRREYLRSLKDDQAEFVALGERTTNLPLRLAELRDQLCADLKLKSTTVPFAAEVMAIAPDEGRWEASAEMVLRSFALSLLVPEAHYQQVRAYIDRTQLVDGRGAGQRLDYLLVGRAADVSGDRVHPQSLLRKLKFRDRHPLAAWVRSEVARRFDYRCCESIAEFNDTPRLAMTENRHVKFTANRHTKDDRPRSIDRRNFVLGWDNREKRRLIAARISELTAEIEKLDQVLQDRSKEIEQLRDVCQAAAEAQLYAEFDRLDVQRHRNELTLLEQERKQLESTNEAIKPLKKRLLQAEEMVEQYQKQFVAAVGQQTRLTDRIAEGEQVVANAKKLLVEAQDSGEYQSHSSAFEAIDQSLGEPLSVERIFEQQAVWASRTRAEASRMRKPLEQLGERLVGAMSQYLREFKEEQSDLNASRESLAAFLGLLEQVRQEDLPRHEKKFKDRLNSKVTEEIGFFHASLNQEQKRIELKIQQLNTALAQLEYRPGTHMELQPRRVKDREIEDFRRSLRECLDESFDGSTEANEARFVRIEKLVARLGDTEKTRWRDKVIDVRNWYSFAARELDKETGDTHSFHEGSSGQSGGEKAKLAFTILVAAIAYQYDLDPTGLTPGRFHFVVVDEMFSKIDDQNAEYALRLFEQFGLQLLIVAPLDAKARVTEPFVDSYLQVVKNETTGHSQLFSMTAREYDAVVRQFDGGGDSGTRRVTAK